MNRRNRIAIIGVLAAMGLVVLMCLAPASTPAPRLKMRAQRITSVNSLRNVTFTMTNSSAVLGAQPVVGK